MSVLSIQNITKKYPGIIAVNDLSLEVEKGNIYGILGPNGSGKTTTLGIVLGITRADAGSFEWFEGKLGHKPNMQIGCLLETPNFYPYMTARKNLEIVAHIKKDQNPRIEELLELVNLNQRADSKFRTYSLGMKQRLAIAAAMVGDPEVLIFDEPTNGLDPEGIAEVRETINKISQRGKTILMASHILAEVEKICSHVAILKKGKLLASGTVGMILTADKLIEISSDNIEALKNMLSNIQGIKSVDEEKGYLIVTLPEDGISAMQMNKLAFQNDITLSRLIERKRSLESEFLEITRNA